MIDLDSLFAGAHPNKELTNEGWYTLVNALHHAALDTGWPFVMEIKEIALGRKEALA